MEELIFYRTALQRLTKSFLALLDAQDYMQPELDKHVLLYSERFMELMVDLQALLPTRRYVNVLIDDLHLIVICQLSPLLEHPNGHLFSQVGRTTKVPTKCSELHPKSIKFTFNYFAVIGPTKVLRTFRNLQ